jgi:hypothetical protein
MLYKTVLISFLCLFVYSHARAQEDVKDLTTWQRMYIGGDLGLSFGTNTYINISPYLGYRFTNRLSAGIGPIYIYEKYKYYDYYTGAAYSIKSATYGVRGLASFIIFKDIGQYIPIALGNIIFHTENELMSIEKLFYDYSAGRYYDSDERIWIDNWLIGGGLNQPFGARGGMNIFVLWDVTQNYYSPHSNPIIRLGFYF